MRQLIIQNLRERNLRFAGAVNHQRHHLNHGKTFSSSKRLNHSVALQLDYYMSAQFGGVASALVNGLYTKQGLDVAFLPICPVGLEQERVRKHQDEHPGCVAIGSVEQNIFIPTLYNNPSLNVKTVAAMFRRSPLCVASTSNKVFEKNAVIGAHEDTLELIQRIFPDQKVIASPRATKISDLKAGKLAGIQAYLTTEVLTLQRELGTEPVVIAMEGHNGAKLGYSQTLFTTNEVIGNQDQLDMLKAFLDATFQGWESVIERPEEGVKMVEEARKMLRLDDEENDHWHSSKSFQLEMLNHCNDFVKETRDGHLLGVIAPARFDDATRWLLDSPNVEPRFGLDPSVWHPEQ